MHSDCIPWLGKIDPNGYGHLGKQVAHRAIYESVVGPVPPGMWLDHLCRNRACVNPEHLEPVTPGENIRRGDVWKTHCPKGHELTPENTIDARAYAHYRRRICRTCNREQCRERYLRSKAAHTHSAPGTGSGPRRPRR